MPPIVWIAIALAIAILGFSAGVKMPVLDEVVKPVAEQTSSALRPISWGIGIAVVAVGVIFALARSGR